MGFPSRTPPSAGVLVCEACERAPGGFVCPRCRGLVVDLPCRCAQGALASSGPAAQASRFLVLLSTLCPLASGEAEPAQPMQPCTLACMETGPDVCGLSLLVLHVLHAEIAGMGDISSMCLSGGPSFAGCKKIPNAGTSQCTRQSLTWWGCVQLPCVRVDSGVLSTPCTVLPSPLPCASIQGDHHRGFTGKPLTWIWPC